MNAIVPAAPNTDEVIRVLENSLYPGARPESIALVLSYCRVNGLDPMLKPVHIVPTNVKVGHNKYEWRDVLMPGIADYRIKAARSGQYGGKSEPEFGPEKVYNLSGEQVNAPEWCKVTVSRIVQGHARSFTATERWLENYATAGKDTEAPNRMWRKRAYGQLAKCAEAQALRMAFPEFSGGVPTAEEMEGKGDDFVGQTIDHMPQTPKPEPQQQGMTFAQYLDSLEVALRDAGDDLDTINSILNSERVRKLREHAKNGAKSRLDALLAEAEARAASREQSGETEEDAIPDFPDPFAQVTTPAKQPAAKKREAPPDQETADSFVARLSKMKEAEFRNLDADAVHRAWLKSLDEADYKRVQGAIADRLAARMGAG